MPANALVPALVALLALAACPGVPASGDAKSNDSDALGDRDNDVIASGDGDADGTLAVTPETVDPDSGACRVDADCRGADPCVVGSCVAARCELSARVCPSDGNPCTDAVCRADVGCTSVPNIAPCDDGSACTQNDRCSGGACGGTAVTCDDGEACTSDGCEPLRGCVFTPRVGACDDDDACTDGDHCDAGRCVADSEHACAEPPNSFGCTHVSCDPRVGCSLTNVPGACDDHDGCTHDDVCSDGVCVGTIERCDDGDPCTDDYCDPQRGCVTTNNQAPCEDGDACTVGDRCDGGQCTAGARSATCCDCVDDHDACTIDECTSGGCEPAPSPVVPSEADGGLLVETFETELDPARWTLVSDNEDVVWQRDASWSHEGQWSLYLGHVPGYSYDFGATRALATWRGPVPSDADTLSVYVRSHVAETSCSYDALTVTVDGVALPRPVCGVELGAEHRWDIHVKAGRVVDIGFVFDTLDGDDNDGEGVWLDALRFLRTSEGRCCESASDCARPSDGCSTARCEGHQCVGDDSACH